MKCKCEELELNDEEEKWISEAQRGDAHAIEWIAEKYRKLITQLSKRFYIGTQSLFSREELVQAGYVGLFHAMANYSAQKETALGTYAFSWILGEMRKALRVAVDHTGSYEGIRQIRRFQSEFEATHSREPTIMEMAEGCSMPLWQAASLLNLCLEADADDAADINECGCEARQRSTQEAAEWNIAIEELPAMERRVILLRYFRDLSQTETAHMLGKSQAQISRMERQAIERLKALLTE